MRPPTRHELGLAAMVLVSAAALDAPLTAAPPPGPRAATRGEFLASPTARVRIVTDRWGIPHVRAQRLDDLYFAWGYVTARDRLWQLEYARRAARGELWEWLGNAKLREDGGAQLFELATRARGIWEREQRKPDVAVALRRYADGVNAYVAECRRGVHPWPRELLRLHRNADDWRPEDSVLLLLAQGMVLDFDLPEIGEQDEIASHGRAWVDARHRFENAFGYHTIPDTAAARLYGAGSDSRDRAPARAVSEAPHAARAAAALGTWLPAYAAEPDQRASNVFAVSARRAARGKPMLANDPHLGLGTPGPLYVVHLSVPGRVDAVGACVPGLPTIVSGRNRRVAWGITALSADVIDVYADTLSADGRHVRWNGGWVKLREEPFAMRFRLPGGLTIPTFGQRRRYTPHGPVVAYEPRRHLALSVRWACDDGMIRLERLVGLERSASATELVARYRDQVTPGLNVVAADVSGRVIYRAVGSVPRRGFAPPRGLMPGDGRHEWAGLIPPDSMPSWQPPPDGFVVNANNLPAVVPREPWPRYDWPHDRALRMAERLAGDRRVTLADMASVQNDVFSKGAARFVPRLLRCADSLAATLGPDARAALDTLRRWDDRARTNRVAPSLYRAWYGALQRRSGLDNLQGLTAAALDGRAPEALRGPRGAPERPALAAAAALDTALVHMRLLLGPSPSRWTWGRAHRARFKHALREIAPQFEPGAVAADGDNSTPCVGRSSLPGNVEFGHGPVFRHVVDLAAPDSSLGVVVPGNSGDLASPHATDMLRRWANHGYVPFLMDWARIEAVKESETTLEPGR